MIDAYSGDADHSFRFHADHCSGRMPIIFGIHPGMVIVFPGILIGIISESRSASVGTLIGMPRNTQIDGGGMFGERESSHTPLAPGGGACSEPWC
ncbi:MAG: hypothetical protein IT204_26330 [Fimbriimonadaceae bacterium]|nr:hypothetical protein [Fimbriimonadaceae bacterium]